MKQTTEESTTTTTKEGTKMKAAEKTYYTDARVKELLTQPEIQAAMRTHIDVPTLVIVKKVGKPSMEHHTQRVEGMAGTTLEDAVTINFTITDESHTNFLDPVQAINKKYRIIDYTLGLEANMSGKNFQGYSAVGLKLTVAKLEEVK